MRWQRSVILQSWSPRGWSCLQVVLASGAETARAGLIRLLKCDGNMLHVAFVSIPVLPLTCQAKCVHHLACTLI